MRFYLIVLPLLLPFFGWADTSTIVIPPDNPVCIGKSCPYVISKDNYKASISCVKSNCILTASDGSSIEVTQNLQDNLDSHLSYTWFTPTLLAIHDNYQQGPAAYFDDRVIFIDFKALEISPIFFSVYAFDLNPMVVLCESATVVDQTPNNTIYVIPMFNPKNSQAIQRNFSGYYIHSIYRYPTSHFLPDGDLHLVYLDKQHQRQEEIVPIDYEALGLKSP